VTEEDIKRIADYLDISGEDFLSRFCEKRLGRFSIKAGPDNFCIFYTKETSCLIHLVKPECCARWPFYPAILNDKDNWEMAKDACPGISRNCSFEAFVEQSEGGLDYSGSGGEDE
jgi:Fe-S-cluster containining protein